MLHFYYCYTSSTSDDQALIKSQRLGTPAMGQYFYICAFVHQTCIKCCCVVLGAVLALGMPGKEKHEISALLELTVWWRKTNSYASAVEGGNQDAAHVVREDKPGLEGAAVSGNRVDESHWSWRESNV